jgi:diguanylate cyclase (GGDEF)-like protein/PAS domain S-box-containing protein
MQPSKGVRIFFMRYVSDSCHSSVVQRLILKGAMLSLLVAIGVIVSAFLVSQAGRDVQEDTLRVSIGMTNQRIMIANAALSLQSAVQNKNLQEFEQFKKALTAIERKTALLDADIQEAWRNPEQAPKTAPLLADIFSAGRRLAATDLRNLTPSTPDIAAFSAPTAQALKGPFAELYKMCIANAKARAQRIAFYQTALLVGTAGALMLIAFGIIRPLRNRLTLLFSTLQSQHNDMRQEKDRAEHLALALEKKTQELDAALAQAEALRTHEAAVIDAIPVPVFMKDISGKYRRVNPAFSQATGYPLEEMLGRDAHDVAAPEIAKRIVHEDITLLRQGGKLESQDYLVQTPHDMRNFTISKAPIYDQDGNIEGIVGIMIDITQRKKLEAELTKLAATDCLTGLDNRRAFLKKLEQAAQQWRENQTPWALVMLDLDHFKRVNDQHGHSAGDDVLKLFAQTLQGTLDNLGSVGRLGGEEFAFFLPNTSMEQAAVLTQTLRQRFAERIAHYALESGQVTFSAGVTQGQDCVTTALNQADALLYLAKHKGRDRVESLLHSQIPANTRRRHRQA